MTVAAERAIPVYRLGGVMTQVRAHHQSSRVVVPPSPIFHTNGILLPWGSHRAGRVADQRGLMSCYRIAEMAVALSFGLTFAFVGWWDIAGSIWNALK
jgi:hypothetical protein